MTTKRYRWISFLAVCFLALSGCVYSDKPLVHPSPLFRENPSKWLIYKYKINKGIWERVDDKVIITTTDNNTYTVSESAVFDSTKSTTTHVQFENIGHGFFLAMSLDDKGYYYQIIYKDPYEKNIYEWSLSGHGLETSSRIPSTHSDILLFKECANEFDKTAFSKFNLDAQDLDGTEQLKFFTDFRLKNYVNSCVGYIKREHVAPTFRYEIAAKGA